MKTVARKLAVLAGIAVVSVGITTSVATPAHAAAHVVPSMVDTSWPH